MTMESSLRENPSDASASEPLRLSAIALYSGVRGDPSRLPSKSQQRALYGPVVLSFPDRHLRLHPEQKVGRWNGSSCRVWPST